MTANVADFAAAKARRDAGRDDERAEQVEASRQILLDAADLAIVRLFRAVKYGPDMLSDDARWLPNADLRLPRDIRHAATVCDDIDERAQRSRDAAYRERVRMFASSALAALGRLLEHRKASPLEGDRLDRWEGEST